ncbi:MAG: HAMP domain-containing protein [Clostridia bacterium]|nr:HAMP domain-containing protein [Clostridia bacterium]
MNYEIIKRKIKKIFASVKIKLFFTISLIILSIIIFLIIVNSFALENFYLYSKQKTLKAVYGKINDYYLENIQNTNIETELEKISVRNNFDILIKDNNGINVYTTNKNFSSVMGTINDIIDNFNNGKELEKNERFYIKKQRDNKNGVLYMMLSGKLDNGYFVYIRIPVTFIQDSVNISNNFLWIIAGITILVAAILVTIVSDKFTGPILELNNIAKKMSNLDFSQKYNSTDTKDEIDDLGKSINRMSEKLETTIKQLKNTNIELEKDIEEKSKIDEMRKTFISDVSHELKTPIALIQGYSEGLLENVNSDEESRKFYAEVILDETNKMDKLVKQLLELMKLEYGKREFNNTTFDIVELEKEVIRKSQVMLEENQIELEFEEKQEIHVIADEFYIEQVLTNYITNAIKNVKEKLGKKKIKIYNKIDTEQNKVCIKVFNTGENIKEENLNRIWKRFYKVDESRNREDGGTGIGLSLVKAIMSNYNDDYGVNNVEDGVEFYFELDMKL